MYVAENTRYERKLPALLQPSLGPVSVCVTGATGFVGGHVARLQRERGEAVRVAYRDRARLDRLPELDLEPLRDTVRWCQELIGPGSCAAAGAHICRSRPRACASPTGAGCSRAFGPPSATWADGS